MPSAATFTANAIIVTTDDGQRKTERAYSKLACYGRVIEDIAGLGQGEKVLSVVANNGESLISIANNPSLYPGNTIDGQVDFDAAKTAVFDAIGISGAGGGGGGGGSGLTQSQTRDAVKDGLDQSIDIEAIKTNPIAAFDFRIKTAHTVGATNFTVGQEFREFVKPDGSSVWRALGSTTNLTDIPLNANLERPGTASTGGAATTAGTVIEWRVDIAHGIAPSAFVADEILREFVGADNTSTWRRQGSTSVIATAPIRDNLTRLDYAEILDSISVLGTTVTANQNTIINLLTDGGRLLATTVNRSVDSNGSVTQVTYNLANGTITDLYTYGPNSSSEWVSATRGVLAPTNNDSISNLRIGPTGSRLLYDSTVTITALSGTLTGVDNGDRTLSHVSSGVAAISGPPIAVGDIGVSVVSLTSVTPSVAPVVNAPVTNNRTANLTWTTNNGFTSSGAVVTGGAPGAGTVATPGINASNAFEVIVYQQLNVGATPIILDSSNVDNTAWTASNNYLIGAYTYANDWYYTTEGGGASPLGTTYPASPWIKFKKSGNDIVISSSSDGVTFTDRRTESGVLSGVPTVYLRAFSVNGETQSYDVTVVS